MTVSSTQEPPSRGSSGRRLAAAIGAILVIAAVAVVAARFSSAPAPERGNFRPDGPWTKGRFTLSTTGGRPIFLDPNGRPFYSIGMVYAYDPEAGPYANLTWNRVRWDLEAIKAHGFNTVNLYGDKFLPQLLAWCDEHGLAVILRTSYTDGMDLPPERRDFPDFMDKAFRTAAADHYDTLLAQTKGHPSLLAIDMDQRWLFPLDWSGALHADQPKLGPAAREYLPIWLEARFHSIQALNSAWDRTYASFSDVLADPEIVSRADGSILPLKRHPWRLDIVEYTLWTIDDFLHDLSGALKAKVPGLLLTYTTEHPEVTPFPLTTRASGIDFIAPVHYNKKDWYDRDWIAAGKSIYETRWHWDMQGLPVYIAETGWRTTPLDQWPRVTNYAFARPGDEKHLAGLYLRQNALWSSMPWTVGWAHFKMYDKISEGDFGYLRDDRSEKPVSIAGRATNAFLPVAAELSDRYRATILYPRYALASEKAGMRALATLAYALEADAIHAMEERSADAEAKLSDAAAVMGSGYTRSVVKEIVARWFPFRFAPEVPNGVVVLLAGDPLENLSRADRDALTDQKTVSFARAGLRDERFRATPAWFLEIAGAGVTAVGESIAVPLAAWLNHNGAGRGGDFDGHGSAFDAKTVDAIAAYRGMKFEAAENAAGLDNIQCLGQTLELDAASGASELHAVVAVHGGDVALPLEFVYDDGTRETKWLGVAAKDWSSPPENERFIRTRDTRGAERVMTHLMTTVHPLKKLKGIVLPNDPEIHLFAMTLVVRSEGAMLPVTVEMGGMRLEGVAAWAVFLPKDAVPADRVLARFSDGRPAAILSPDHRHAAFLFDILTWTGSKTMVSRDLETVSKMVRRAIELVEAAS